MSSGPSQAPAEVPGSALNGVGAADFPDEREDAGPAVSEAAWSTGVASGAVSESTCCRALPGGVFFPACVTEGRGDGSSEDAGERGPGSVGGGCCGAGSSAWLAGSLSW